MLQKNPGDLFTYVEQMRIGYKLVLQEEFCEMQNSCTKYMIPKSPVLSHFNLLSANPTKWYEMQNSCTKYMVPKSPVLSHFDP